MLTRRAALIGAFTAGFLPACRRAKRTTYEGIEVVEEFLNGADASSPVVVAMHGSGGEPENFGSRVFGGFGGRCHLVLPRGLFPVHSGWEWFHEGLSDDAFGAELGDAETKVWRALGVIAKGRRMIVTGFSQGGFMSFAMAARHPDEIIVALPAGGSCASAVLPKNHVRTAPVIAFHGDADGVVDIKWGRGAVNAFVEQGGDATIREYRGTGHSLTGAMRADLLAEIQRHLP